MWPDPKLIKNPYSVQPRPTLTPNPKFKLSTPDSTTALAPPTFVLQHQHHLRSLWFHRHPPRLSVSFIRMLRTWQKLSVCNYIGPTDRCQSGYRKTQKLPITLWKPSSVHDHGNRSNAGFIINKRVLIINLYLFTKRWWLKKKNKRKTLVVEKVF